MLKAAKEKREKSAEEMEKNVKETEKLMAKVNAPFTHTATVKRPYEKVVKFNDVYPQLPVVRQEGNYHIKDEDERIIEMGNAQTTIKMYLSAKSKKKRHIWKIGVDKGSEGWKWEMIVRVIRMRPLVDMTQQSDGY